MSNDATKILNGLITTSLDGVHGYRQAADHASDTKLKSLFQQYAQERQSCAASLQTAVKQMGGTPTDDGSVTAAFHRGWIGLKDAFSGGDEPIVKECIRGEEYALKEFEKAAGDASLNGDAKSVVQRLHGEISRALTQMRQLQVATV